MIIETVLSLLVDLSVSTKDKLLSGETPEELIERCKEKYDRVFDLNFPSLGIAGAHELAWREVFYEFSDEVWE